MDSYVETAVLLGGNDGALAAGVTSALQADPRVKWFLVKALNQESIRSHNAYAVIEWERPEGDGGRNG
jgi:hypothetical protein